MMMVTIPTAWVTGMMLAAISYGPELVPPEMLDVPVLQSAAQRIEDATDRAAENSPSRAMDRRTGRSRDRIDTWSVSPMPRPTEAGFQRRRRGRVVGIQARIIW